MNPLLKKEAFKNTYKHQLYLVLKQAASLSTWQYTSTYCRKGACRPETKRKREAGEGKTFRISSSFKCSNYDEWGYNIRTCKVVKGSKSVSKFDLSSSQVIYINFSGTFNR